MNVLLETAFNGLLSRYERAFGEQPPFESGTAEEVMAYMRRRLSEKDRAEAFAASPGMLQYAGRNAGGGPASLHP